MRSGGNNFPENQLTKSGQKWLLNEQASWHHDVAEINAVYCGIYSIAKNIGRR